MTDIKTMYREQLQRCVGMLATIEPGSDTYEHVLQNIGTLTYLLSDSSDENTENGDTENGDTENGDTENGDTGDDKNTELPHIPEEPSPAYTT